MRLFGPQITHRTSPTVQEGPHTISPPVRALMGCSACTDGTWRQRRGEPSRINTRRLPSRSTSSPARSVSTTEKGGLTAHPATSHSPAGDVHGFRNESNQPAAMLILIAPGAPPEEYFKTLAHLGEGLVLSDEDRADCFPRHDTYRVSRWQARR